MRAGMVLKIANYTVTLCIVVISHHTTKTVILLETVTINSIMVLVQVMV